MSNPELPHDNNPEMTPFPATADLRPKVSPVPVSQREVPTITYSNLRRKVVPRRVTT